MPVIDCDLHVMEPADLWSSVGLPVEGHGWNGVTVGGHKLPDAPGEWETDDEAYNGGPAAVYAEGAADGWGPTSLLAMMDREGINRAVLVPTRGGAAIAADGLDPILVTRICGRYNEWIAEQCLAMDKRAGAYGLLGLHDPSAAVAIAAHAKSLGLFGVVTRPNPINGKLLSHPDFDVLYSALESMELPLVLHEGTGAHQETLGLDRAATYLEAHAMSHTFEQMAAVLAFTIGGVFARHPKLRVGFFEAGAGWLPYWLDRLDDHALGLFAAKEYTLPARPSRYFKAQGFVTLEPGENLSGIKQAGLLDCVLFGSDIPHGDSHFPYATKDARLSAGGSWQSISDRNAVGFLFGRDSVASRSA